MTEDQEHEIEELIAAGDSEHPPIENIELTQDYLVGLGSTLHFNVPAPP